MTHVTVPAAIDTEVRHAVGSTPTDGPFAFTFVFFELDDVAVYHIDGATVTILERDVDFTVDPVTTYEGGYAGGEITLTEEVQDVDILIVYEGPLERTDDFPNAGQFVIRTLNTTLDRLMTLLQMLRGMLRRTLLIPITSDIRDLELPLPGAGQYFKWNAAGTAIETAPIPDDLGALAEALAEAEDHAATAAAAAVAADASADAAAASAAAAAASAAAAAASEATLGPAIAFYVNLDDTQTIASSDFVKIMFSKATLGFDTEGYWDDVEARYTPLDAGVYQFGISIKTTASINSPLQCQAAIRVNGGHFVCLDFIYTIDGTEDNGVCLNATGLWEMDGVDDYVEGFAYIQVTGGDIAGGITSIGLSSNMWGCRIK